VVVVVERERERERDEEHVLGEFYNYNWSPVHLPWV